MMFVLFLFFFRLYAASPSSPPVVVQTRQIGLVSKRLSVFTKRSSMLALDITSLQGLEYAPSTTTADSGTTTTTTTPGTTGDGRRRARTLIRGDSDNDPTDEMYRRLAGSSGGNNSGSEDAMVQIIEAPEFDGTATGGEVVDMASVDLQLTQWSARFNPFGGSESLGGDEEGCGNTTDGTSCLESTDVFTFTLRHKGADVSALHVRPEMIRTETRCYK